MENKLTKKQLDFRTEINNLEKTLLNTDHPRIVTGKKLNEALPLTHSFSDGIYVREMKLPKGCCVIGKIHKKSNTWFLLKGKLAIATSTGVKTYTAPIYMNAPAGEQKIAYALEDSVFINVCPNPENKENIKELELDIVTDSYESYDRFIEDKQKYLKE